MLPFTRDQFMAVFAGYNDAVWPLQSIAYLLGIVAVAALFRPGRAANQIIAAVLAAFWLWTGVAYHGLFFAPINIAAYGFAALFVVQGLAFAYAGATGDGLRFGFQPGPAAWVGAAFVVYAAIVYPLIGIGTGHVYPDMPMFGITPCPVTIFTFGLLLMTTARFSRWLLVIPFLWSLVGGSAAFLLGVQQDWLLLFAGVIAVALIVARDRGAPQVAKAA